MINDKIEAILLLLEKKKNVMRPFCMILLFLSPLLMFGQKVEGLVQYEQTINMHRNLKGNDEMKQYIPEFQTSRTELLMKGSTVLYRSAPQNEEMGFEGGDGNVKINFKRSEAVVYRDLKAKEQLTATEFMGRKFLISDEVEKRAWKMTPESKSILGYPCTKAVYQDTADVIEAWFTLAIPVGAGPGSYDGLPGLILEVNKNDGESVISATAVDLKPLEEEIEKPDKGKKVTKKEYDDIVEEKMKEMGASGGGGRMIMIIRN
jgi:GLPGLI family protein